jgi:hypothetical protein
MIGPMKAQGTRILVFGTAATLAVIGVSTLARADRNARRTPPPSGSPVVVELFTSEGCSSCPPADRLLAELDSAGTASGVPIVALSEHVDYWDRLGWKDPFSSSSLTHRQNAYSAWLHSQIYTPQVVIDGRWEMIGSDRSRVQSAIARAGRESKARVTVEATRGVADLTVHATVEPGDLGRLPDADLYVAVTEGGLASTVTAGENQGRRLAHAAVTRRLQKAGRIKGGTNPAQVSETFNLDPAWDVDRSVLVVFVQARDGSGIVGAWAGSLPVQQDTRTESN